MVGWWAGVYLPVWSLLRVSNLWEINYQDMKPSTHRLLGSRADCMGRTKTLKKKVGSCAASWERILEQGLALDDPWLR